LWCRTSTATKHQDSHLLACSIQAQVFKLSTWSLPEMVIPQSSVHISGRAADSLSMDGYTDAACVPMQTVSTLTESLIAHKKLVSSLSAAAGRSTTAMTGLRAKTAGSSDFQLSARTP
jgi:hypothetical protein